MSRTRFEAFTPAWLDRFRANQRDPQVERSGLATFSVISAAKKVLRIYTPVVSVSEDGDIQKSINNMTEFQRGGAVAVLMNSEKKVGLIEINRPVVPIGRLQEYREIWDQQHLHPNDFAEIVAPMLGAVSLEFPQGYSDVFESGLETALREAGEEGGCLVQGGQKVGYCYSDTANRADPIEIFLVHVDPTMPAKESPDPFEKMTGRVSVWVDQDEYRELVRTRQIFSGTTKSARDELDASRIW